MTSRCKLYSKPPQSHHQRLILSLSFSSFIATSTRFTRHRRQDYSNGRHFGALLSESLDWGSCVGECVFRGCCESQSLDNAVVKFAENIDTAESYPSSSPAPHRHHLLQFRHHRFQLYLKSFLYLVSSLRFKSPLCLNIFSLAADTKVTLA